MSERWLSADDIAGHLGVTKDTIYAWIAPGMPAHKVGRLWRFQVSEVDEWVRTSRDAQSQVLSRAVTFELRVIDNLNELLGDDLKATIRPRSSCGSPQFVLDIRFRGVEE